MSISLRLGGEKARLSHHGTFHHGRGVREVGHIITTNTHVKLVYGCHNLKQDWWVNQPKSFNMNLSSTKLHAFNIRFSSII